MARQYPDLINDLAIIQGEDYLELVNNAVIKLPGDLTAGTPTGQVRDNYLENGGILLASFSFESSTYNATDDETTIKPYLTNAETSALGITSFKTGKTPSLRNCYVYDFEVDLNGVKHKLAAAFIQVKGEVTGVGSPSPSSLETFLLASNNLSEVTDKAAARANLEIIGGVKPDWNATPGTNEEIINKPDLTVFETTAQLNARDVANRVRTNHTGFQSIATVTGLQTALDSKEPADPTILKNANLGVTVQPFNANTVTDTDYPTVKSTALSAVQPGALGTAAATESTDYATSAQGALATTALQPSALNNTALTGIPTAPTAAEGTNTTQLATTAFVLANSSPGGLANPVEVVFQSIQTVTYNQGGTSTLDNSTHNVFSLAANGSGTTIAHSNVPLTSNRYGFELHLAWTTGTITWPATWTKGMNPPGGVGNYAIQGFTIDGGTSWTINVIYQ